MGRLVALLLIVSALRAQDFVLAGRVRDGAGRPLAGVFVAGAVGGATTGADGRFRIEGLAADVVHLAFAKPGFVALAREAVAGDEALDVVLQPAGTILGRVETEDGRPAAAEVSFDGCVAPAPSGADGVFALRDVAPGTVRVRAKRGDLRAGAEVRVEAGGTAAGVRLVLAPGRVSWLALRVVDHEGRPVAEMEVDRGGRGPGTTLQVCTGENGVWRERVEAPPGTEVRGFVLPHAGAPHLGARFAVATREGEAPVDVRLPEPKRVVLRVDPPPEVLAGSFPRGLGCVESWTPPTLVLHLHPEPWAPLALNLESYDAGRRLRPFEPKDDTVRLEPYPRIRGRVVNGEGQPLAGAFVDGRAVEGDGTFLLRHSGGELALGRDREAIETIFPFEAKAGLTDLGDVRLGAPRPWTGTVRGGDGKPLGGVLVTPLCRHARALPRTATRADGTWRLTVPAGVERVLLWKPGYGRTHVAEGDAVLPRGGAVRVAAPIPEDVPAAPWRYVVRAGRGGPVLLDGVTWERTVELPDLPPDPLFLETEPFGATAEVTPSPGTVREAKLR